MDSNPADFEAIFLRCHDPLMRYVVRRVGPQDAPDLVAEAFAIALRRWSSGTPSEPLPWLYAVAHNLLRNDRRRRAAEAGRNERLVGALAGLVSAEPSVERVSMIDALRTLSPDDREVLYLAAWEELEARHIAVVLGCSPATARVRLHRARRRLADALATTGPAAPASLKRSIT